MKLFAAGCCSALTLCSAVAHAVEPPPAAHRGFQLALRTGVAVPFGDVTRATAMSDALGVQVPFLVDVGAKVLPQLFVGVYLGAAVGGAAGQVENQCTRAGVNCTGLGFRFGLLAQYNFLPKALINPWVGYGFGYEIAGSSGSNGSNTITNRIRGFELAHLLGGVDFRLQDWFGIGPFLDVALGRYDVAESEVNAGGSITSLGGTVTEKAFHAWGIFGVRATMLP